MEQFVLGIFQEQLSKIIIGFRKEQVNANLLNGKGEITNVELNCAFLNNIITKMTPHMELESVHVSRLSFQVTSWTNLRKAPIVVDIEHVHVRAVEPLHFQERVKKTQFRQVLPHELEAMIREGLVPPKASAGRGAYGIFDRIVDNLTVEIASVTFEFQPLGKFKTRRKGPWTPPAVQAKLACVRLVSVNEYGQEASAEEVWRHNHHNSGTLFLYKKLELEYQLALMDTIKGETIPLVSGRDNKVEVHMATQRRVVDGEYLAIQIDVTIPRFDIDLSARMIPIVAHAIAAITFCMAKDRHFRDPLKTGESVGLDEKIHEAKLVVFATDDDAMNIESSTDTIPDELDIDSASSSSSEGDDENPLKNNAEDLVAPDTLSSLSEDASFADQLGKVCPPQSDRVIRGRPVMLMPNGFIIRERLSLSVSFHEIIVRGNYADNSGSVRMEAKGFVTELLWPRVNEQKGGYAQASIAFLSITEKFGSKIRPLIIGGVQYDDSGPLEKPGVPLAEVGRDDTFPLFEDRCVRPDPIRLRHSYPAQAFGIKTTAEIIHKLVDKSITDSNSSDQSEFEEILFMNEIGIDQFDIVADVHAWGRVIEFLLNVQGGGFNPRWYSGDWGQFLTKDMLLRPNEPLILENCLQPTKMIFLDDNYFPSSDLFNLTARMTKLILRVPSALHEDVWSCDIVSRLDETLLVVSSALPRTFLTGNLGSSVNGDESEKKGVIDFPNDHSDISYLIENAEDPSNRQRGVMTTRPISTFRMQLIMRSYSISINPVVPLVVGDKPQQLIGPSEFTVLLCFEGEPPTEPQSNLIKIVLFASTLVHRLDVNLDLELLSSAIGTITWHASAAREISKKCTAVSTASATTSEGMELKSLQESSGAVKIRKSLRGRRALVYRQFTRSRETGGMRVALLFQVSEARIQLWGRNIPGYPNTFATQAGDSHKESGLLKVCVCEILGLEMGFEGSFQKKSRRVAWKACLSSATLQVNGFKGSCSQTDLVDLFRLEGHNSDVNNFGGDGLCLRADEIADTSRSWALSAIISRGVVACHVVEVESALLIISESLLARTSAKNFLDNGNPNRFPQGTVGQLLSSFLASWKTATDSSAFINPVTISAPQLGIKHSRVKEPAKTRAGSILPKDVQFFLISISVNNFVASIASVDDELQEISYVLQELDFVAQSVKGPVNVCRLLDVIARPSKRWSMIMCSHEQGLRHQLQTRQCVKMKRLENEGIVGVELVLVRDLMWSYKYENSKACVSSDQFLIENIENLRAFMNIWTAFVARCKNTVENIRSSLVSLKSYNDLSSACDADHHGPVAIACHSLSELASRITDLVRSLNDRVRDYSYMVHDRMKDSDKRMDKLQQLVFTKEKDRLAALGLVSMQLSGIVRWGAAQRSGIRGLLSCTLWPYWLVLKESALLVYNRPGSFEPVAIVSLIGASLRQLSGGQRRRDLKRAFAMVDNAGTTHFFVAENDRDYYNWVGQLRSAIDRFFQSATTNEDIPDQSQLNDYDDLDPTERQDELGANHIQEQQDESGGLSNAETENAESSTGDTSDRSPQRNLRNRLAGVGQATKTRFGSAIQAVAERTKRNRGNPADPATQDSTMDFNSSHGSVRDTGNGSDDVSAFQSPLVGSSSQTEEIDTAVARRGMRLRLSAAVRNVRRGGSPPANEISRQRFSFTVKPRNVAGQNDFGDLKAGSESSKLRQVSLDGDLSAVADPIMVAVPKNDADLPLKKFQGCWHVQVNIYSIASKAKVDTSEGNTTISSEATPDLEISQGDVRFHITLLRRSNEGEGMEDVSTVIKSRPDILGFYVSLTESISRLPISHHDSLSLGSARIVSPNPTENKATALGLNSFEILLITGKLLEGLLETNVNHSIKMWEAYACRAVAEFLNSLFDCPLPVDALANVTEFLNFMGSSTRARYLEIPELSANDEETNNKLHKSLMEINEMVTECERQLLRVENQSAIAERLARSRRKNVINETKMLTDHSDLLRDVSVSNQFQDAMHAALLKVMEERDRAHTRMVAGEVLHVHELEQERRKVSKLASQLDSLNARLEVTSKLEETKINSTALVEQKMQQNTDLELVALCQQLSHEIAGRTEASLEICRLKEARKIERENDLAEKMALANEIKQLKEQLEQERKKAETAESELSHWKKLFHQLLDENMNYSAETLSRTN